MNKRTSATIYETVLMAGLLVGCSPALPPEQPTAATGTEALLQTMASPSALPTDTHDQCFGARQALPKGLEGEFILSGKYDLYRPALESHQSPSYVMEPNTGEKTQLPETENPEAGGFIVSPNRRELAYIIPNSGDMRNGKLLIVGNGGKISSTYLYRGWFDLVAWIADSRLLASKLSYDYPFPTIVFDPQNGAEMELSPDYPDIDPEVNLPSWGKYLLIRAAYSPDLKFVAYAKSGQDIVLWDRAARRVLAEIAGHGAASGPPLWLSSGREFVIAFTSNGDSKHWSQDELLSISVDGRVRQLTHLSEAGQDDSIGQYSVSADGQFIAFWFNQDGLGQSRLAIYDMQTASTRVYCVRGSGYVQPVWSPQSHQLLVDGYFDSIEDYGTILVDIDSGVLAEVQKGVIPLGWMIGP